MLSLFEEKVLEAAGYSIDIDHFSIAYSEEPLVLGDVVDFVLEVFHVDGGGFKEVVGFVLQLKDLEGSRGCPEQDHIRIIGDMDLGNRPSSYRLPGSDELCRVICSIDPVRPVEVPSNNHELSLEEVIHNHLIHINDVKTIYITP